MKRKSASCFLNKPTYLAKRPNADLLWKHAVVDESDNFWYIHCPLPAMLYHSLQVDAFSHYWYKFGSGHNIEPGNGIDDLEKDMVQFATNTKSKPFGIFAVSLCDALDGIGHRTNLVISQSTVVRFDSHNSQRSDVAILFDEAMAIRCEHHSLAYLNPFDYWNSDFSIRSLYPDAGLCQLLCHPEIMLYVTGTPLSLLANTLEKMTEHELDAHFSALAIRNEYLKALNKVLDPKSKLMCKCPKRRYLDDTFVIIMDYIGMLMA
jgi:hypothetical protein